MHPILSMGLSQEWVSEISHRLSARVHTAGTLCEARELLSEYDFSSVVLDLDHEHLEYDEVCDLLGRAPLTTRFVALCGGLCEREASSLAAVGITTVRVSTGLDGLIEHLPR